MTPLSFAYFLVLRSSACFVRATGAWSSDSFVAEVERRFRSQGFFQRLLFAHVCHVVFVNSFNVGSVFDIMSLVKFVRDNVYGYMGV